MYVLRSILIGFITIIGVASFISGIVLIVSFIFSISFNTALICVGVILFTLFVLYIVGELVQTITI